VADSQEDVQGAVEGIVDEAVLRRLFAERGIAVGRVYGRGGKQQLLQRLASYNEAARFSPWVVLVDLDADFDCAPQALGHWLPTRAPRMHLRIAVRAIEAWLLADRSGIAKFLGVPMSRIPLHPDAEMNPKQAIVGLARRSRRPVIQADLAPRSGSGRAQGVAYASRMIEFATHHWNVDAAARRSESLDRALRRIIALSFSLGL
jgi:hypothetical protein